MAAPDETGSALAEQYVESPYQKVHPTRKYGIRSASARRDSPFQMEKKQREKTTPVSLQRAPLSITQHLVTAPRPLSETPVSLSLQELVEPIEDARLVEGDVVTPKIQDFEEESFEPGHCLTSLNVVTVLKGTILTASFQMPD